GRHGERSHGRGELQWSTSATTTPRSSAIALNPRSAQFSANFQEGAAATEGRGRGLVLPAQRALLLRPSAWHWPGCRGDGLVWEIWTMLPRRWKQYLAVLFRELARRRFNKCSACAS
ncbi:unnamed protein product, partial [Ascophyllum nodosum]